MVTAVILAGGNSKRMGRDKLELDFGGRTMLQSVVDRFGAEFGEVCISVADPEKYAGIATRRITDILPGAGPLSGLHAALSQTRADGVFLVAADLPYAEPRAAKRIIELRGDCEACLIMLPDGKLEPLFGYYGNSLLGRCEEAILSGEFRMTEIIRNSAVRYVDISELGDLWDDKLILNINTPNDYQKLLG